MLTMMKILSSIKHRHNFQPLQYLRYPLTEVQGQGKEQLKEMKH